MGTEKVANVAGLDWKNFGVNIEKAFDGDMLYLRINVKHQGEDSKSGKSTVVGSTEGNKSVEHPLRPGIKAGINLYVSK